MATYVKFELEDGTSVYVETTDSPKGASGLIPSTRSVEAGKAGASFEKAVAGLRTMASAMVNGLRGEEEGQQPDEVQINFGLKAATDLDGFIISRGGMESNYNVMLRWRNEKKQDKKESSDTPEKDETKED
jgi:hypothetical protein